jgi:hypothetical protein
MALTGLVSRQIAEGSRHSGISVWTFVTRNIQPSCICECCAAWMAGTSPAMTALAIFEMWEPDSRKGEGRVHAGVTRSP